ncbi:tyrosine-protein phosphatase non-receptor type 21-like [Rhopilema esculentum]|uniref:tyrosine-protein phosphatase non-receptor type 21-like n=1 Tax=Rhopilema esculentum TaxID=499914 RepID=UPI0031D96CEA
MPLQLNKDLLHKGVYKSDKTFPIKVKLLDNTVINLNLPYKARGRECLEKIAQSLGLEELNYFGLQYTNKKQQMRWIEMNKGVKKQLDRNGYNSGKEAMLGFRIQFFATDCRNLHQEITRYLYYLQLKSLVIEEVLKCRDDVSFRLAALAIQAEFGDHDQEKHTLDFIEDFVLLPQRIATNYSPQEINEKIMHLHQKNSGMSPASAELNYILLCQQIEGYGEEVFTAKDKDGTRLEIIASFLGIKIKSSLKLHPEYFKWQEVANMAFNRQYFCIERMNAGETVQFETADTESAKFIWRQCIAQHQFFRLQHSTVESPNFRTQHELMTDVKLQNRSQEDLPFQRRVTLTRKEGRERRQREREDEPVVNVVGISNAAFNDLDNDGIDGTTPQVNSITQNAFLSVRSTASSGYDSSESGSGSEAGSIGRLSGGRYDMTGQGAKLMGSSATSPILRRHQKETRDFLLKQLENVIAEDQVYVEFEQVFSKKLNCNLTTASLVANAERNRNREVLPYEENRVILDVNNNRENNDYINASTIKVDVGKSQSVSYVAAQSPLERTVDDFWQMIWEHGIQLCVMVTKEEEAKKRRCFRYWPFVGEPQSQHGMYSISVKFENTSKSFVTRGFTVENSKTRETKDVYQMQYMNWPDAGIPEDPAEFVDFLEEVRSLQKSLKDMTSSKSDCNLLVHCSNGAGRTGVFILCETLIKLIENNQTFDVPMILARLRTQRMYIVETVSQYRFVYLAVINYLQRNRLI